MTGNELRARVLEVLTSIAPEVTPEDLRDERPLRQQVDLDSVDWLNFLVGLHAAVGVEIPESDYGRLVSLADLLRYLGERIDGAGKTGR
jgi:acyl carrier protein